MTEEVKKETLTEDQSEDQDQGQLEGEVSGQAEPSPEQRLDMSEILSSLQVANSEVTRWQGIANTLTKCAILFDSIIKAQQAQQTQQKESTSEVSENS